MLQQFDRFFSLIKLISSFESIFFISLRVADQKFDRGTSNAIIEGDYATSTHHAEAGYEEKVKNMKKHIFKNSKNNIF